MKYVLGLDQGGSKTHAIIADETGRILGMGKSFGTCHSSSSVEYAMRAVLEACDMALEMCGLAREDIHTIFGGITGVDWSHEAKLLESAIGVYFQKADIQVVNDCIIAMRAATMSEKCGILCAGSGFNCAVQSGKERFVYGFYIADEYQGGTCLGKRTVQAVFNAEMGIIGCTALTDKVLKFFHAESPEQLLFWQVTGKIRGEDYLKLPILLEEAASLGDREAIYIWEQYGREMVVFLTARMKKMQLCDQNVDIVLSGSIFKCKIKSFQNTVKEEIQRNMPKATIIEAEYEPVAGAALMGLRKMTGQVNEFYYACLEEAAERFPIKRMKNKGPQ